MTRGQILSDVLGRDLAVPAAPSMAAARGAAALAGLGLGWWPPRAQAGCTGSPAACEHAPASVDGPAACLRDVPAAFFLSGERLVLPDPGRVRAYAELLAVFERVQEAVRQPQQDLAEWRRRHGQVKE